MPTIKVMKNGPYVVSNLENFKNSKFEPIENKETMALCRCGASANKPFCDGTHGKISFDSKLEADRSTHYFASFTYYFFITFIICTPIIAKFYVRKFTI